MILFVLLLAAAGATYAIQAGKASILTNHMIKLRFFREMFMCSFCTGCQCGFWLFFVHSYATVGFSGQLFFAVPFGLASGVVSSLIDEITG